MAMKPAIRSLLVIPPAALLTFLLIMIMVSLIEYADRDIDERPRIRLPEIGMPDAELRTQRTVERPERPEMDQTPPPDVPRQEFDNIDGNAAVGRISAPSRVSAELDLNIGSGLSASDGEYLPIVRVAPRYPQNALNRGLEGWVIVEYTVTRQGSVRDPVVVESSSGVFERAAVESALRYRYRPRVVDGEAVEVPGVQTRITFALEQ